ncbi:MAG: serine/threonine-protein kinase, partial [Pyrinomonadaceae bacterium]
MTSEQWQRVKELFEATSERGPAERAAFLAQAGAGDEEVRREVESLLAAHDSDTAFMNEPAGNLLGATPMLAAGQRFGQYEEISLLGEGGMGQVYLAVDTRLGRKVAIKLLPSSYTDDADRVRRFGQEARAASALNHPNIITIYEIGQIDDKHFIATEFIDGQTLRDQITGSRTQVGGTGNRLAGPGLKLTEILNIVMQVADALAAAHEAGIVHRDIKPENIMVRRRDGFVKVLDFGLAKLTEATAIPVDAEAPTRAQVQTSAGVVMGTATYMSPEQARGEKVDARTDIWSLGVVFYELVAGCVPFDRATPSEVIALILERQPPPLARYAREVPPELERIVSKALIKDREERYQTAKDLLVDLRRLRRQLDLEAEIERFSAPGTGAEAAFTADRVTTTDRTTEESDAPTQAVAARPTSSTEFLLGELRSHKRGVLLGLAIISLTFAGIGFGLYKLFRNQPPAPAQFQSIDIT